MADVEPWQDFVERIRFHSPLDEAMKKFREMHSQAKTGSAT